MLQARRLLYVSPQRRCWATVSDLTLRRKDRTTRKRTREDMPVWICTIAETDWSLAPMPMAQNNRRQTKRTCSRWLISTRHGTNRIKHVGRTKPRLLVLAWMPVISLTTTIRWEQALVSCAILNCKQTERRKDLCWEMKYWRRPPLISARSLDRTATGQVMFIM